MAEHDLSIEVCRKFFFEIVSFSVQFAKILFFIFLGISIRLGVHRYSK